MRCGEGNSLRFSAPPSRGRSRCARSSRAGCRPSGSWARARLRTGTAGPPPSCSGCASSAGPRGARSRSSIAGRTDAASATPSSRPNSSGARWMSSSRWQARSLPQCRQPRRSRSCSRWRGTRLGAVWSRVSRAPAATSPAYRSSRAILPANGSSFRARCSPASVGWRSSPISELSGAALEIAEAQTAARKLGLDVDVLEIRRAEDIVPAFGTLNERRAGALCMSRSPGQRQPRAHQHLGARRATADDSSLPRLSRSGRFHVLRSEQRGPVPSRRRLCRQDTPRGKARRPSGRAADQVRARLQPGHRQGAWPHGVAACCSPAPTR